MSAADWAVLLAVGVGLFLSLRSVFRQKGGCPGCSGCPSGGSCPSKKPKR